MSAAPLIARNVSFALRSDVDIVAARRGVRDWAREIGLTVLELTKIVTATSKNHPSHRMRDCWRVK